MPSWVNFHNKKADEIHNIYGHDWARLIFEGYQKELPNERPFILMRAGYSGSQRFGMIPWCFRKINVACCGRGRGRGHVIVLLVIVFAA